MFKNRGDRGVTGERGPKGDHGQPGEGGMGGERGPRGFSGKDAPKKALIGYLILSFFFVGSVARIEQVNNKIEGRISSNVIERKRVDEKLAKQAENQLEVIRLILCAAAKQSETSKQRTEEEKVERRKFYKETLEKIHAKPCAPL